MAKSRKKLRETLVKLGVVTNPTVFDGLPSYSGMMFETYGNKTMAYIYLQAGTKTSIRRDIERKLEEEGWKVNDGYSPGKPVIEVEVSYFKAFGWDK